MKTLLKKVLKALSPMKEKEVVYLKDINIDRWIITDEQKDLLTIATNGITKLTEDTDIGTKYKHTRIKLLVGCITNITNNLELIKD